MDTAIPTRPAGTFLFQDFFEAHPNGVLLVRSDGSIAHANGRAAAIFGYQPTELIGRPVEDLVPEASREIHRDLRVIAARKGIPRPMGDARSLPARRRDGSSFPIEVGLASFTSEGETLICAVVSDVSERIAAERRSRGLTELSAALSATARVDEIAELVVHRVAAILGARDVGLVLREGDQLVLVRRSRSDHALTEPIREGVDVPGAVAAAARTGQPILPVGTARPQLGAFGFEWALPLLAAGGILGSIGISFETTREIGAADVPFLELLARTSAQALERARLYEAERRSRARAGALARLSAAVADAQTVEQVADLLLDEAYASSGARVVALARLDEPAGEFELIGIRSGDRQVPSHGRWPATLRSAAKDVVESGTHVLVDQAGYRARYPEVSEISDPSDLAAYLALPLTVAGRAVGSIAFTFDTPPIFEEDDIGHLQAIADAGAQAMERARVLEADRRARIAAEDDRRFADEAAEVLSGTLRPRDAAAALAALVVPTYADWCAVDLGDETGRIRDTVIVHRDPDKVALGYRLRERMGPKPDDPTGPPAILRNGQHEFIETIPPDYANAIPDSELARIVGGLAITSYLAVPIRARNRTLGVLSVFMAESGRRFTSADLHRMLDLGRRAGVAFDNATLYEAVVRVAEDERRARERADALTRLSAAVAEARGTEEVAGLLLRELVAATGARAASVVLLEGPDFVETASVVGEPRIVGLQRFPRSEPSPAAHVLESHDVLVLSAAEFRERFPALGGPDGGPWSTMVTLPLVIGATPVGAAALLFEDDRELGAADISHLRGLADGGAQALERARLADTERRARATLDEVLRQLPAAILVAEPSGEVVYVNEHVRTLLRGIGRLRVEEFGVSARRPDGTTYEAEDYPLARSLATGEIVVDEEMELVRFDGTSVTVLASSSPVRGDDGSILAAVVVMSDISSRKEVEAAREAFIGGLSHELRTPITSIFGNAALLRRRRETMSAAAVEELVDDIAAEADRMRRIVEDLLMLARVERGIGLDGPEPVLLQHRIRAVVDRVAARWPTVHFEMQIEPDLPPIRGDDTYVERSLENLVDNAAKYGESTVRVTARWEGDAVVVGVIDDGPGVDPSESEAIFGVFYRSKRDAQRAAGAGIGLFLVRALVSAMGGTVRVSAAATRGAVFTITLPIFREDQAA